MARTQQTFVNDSDVPMFVSVEPWPEYFKLDATDELTLIWNASDEGETVRLSLLDKQHITIWPTGDWPDLEFLINGQPGRDKSWNFDQQD